MSQWFSFVVGCREFGLVVLLVACGCNSSAPTPDASLVEGSDEQLLTNVIRAKSVEELRVLLQRNEVDSTGIKRIGTTTTHRAGDSRLVTVVQDAAQIRSVGSDFSVVSTIVVSHARENVPDPPEVPIVYIFSVDGQVLNTIGSRDYMSEDSARNITVLTLGTKDSWFVLAERWDFTGDSEHRYSDLYLLSDPIEKVLTVRHLYDSMGYTGTEEQAGHFGPVVSFSRTRSHAVPFDAHCIAADDSSHPPRINWIAEQRFFSGPSKLTFKGEFLFEVDTEASTRFQPTDISPEEPKGSPGR